MSRPRITRTHIHTGEAHPRSGAADAQASLQLLRLLHLASPALPIGAFHFSQGLEHAVEARWVTDEASALGGASVTAGWRLDRATWAMTCRPLGCATTGSRSSRRDPTTSTGCHRCKRGT